MFYVLGDEKCYLLILVGPGFRKPKFDHVDVLKTQLWDGRGRIAQS